MYAHARFYTSLSHPPAYGTVPCFSMYVSIIATFDSRIRLQPKHNPICARTMRSISWLRLTCGICMALWSQIRSSFSSVEYITDVKRESALLFVRRKNRSLGILVDKNTVCRLLWERFDLILEKHHRELGCSLLHNYGVALHATGASNDVDNSVSSVERRPAKLPA